MAEPSFHYHSGSGKVFIGEQPERIPSAPRAFLAAPKPLFRIRLQTTQFAPGHVVTIRNDADGWSKDTYGIYQNHGWDFYFDKPSLPDNLQFKFVLNGEYWMTGANLSVATLSDAFFDESQIQFPHIVPRFRHGYDNFHLERTKLAQEAVPRNTREDILYDVIVIGSGIGGGTLADSLADAGVNTLVLEAGGLTFPTHITNLPGDWSRLPDHHKVGHFENEPGSGFLSGVHMSLGGRSVYWSGLIPRMREWELAFWPAEIRSFFNNGGYKLAETLMRKRKRLGPFQDGLVTQLAADFPEWKVEDTPRSRHQPFIDETGELQNILQSSTGVFSTADLLLSSLAYHGQAGRDNLTINLGHLVTRIETDNSSITKVTCQDIAGNTVRRYRGKIIVLAAGSLESPKIALNSQLQDPNQKIGLGLTDHPAFFPARYNIPDTNPLAGSDHHAKIFMSRKQASISDHPFNIEVLINPAFWHLRNADDDLLRAPNPTQIEMKFIFSSFLDDDNFIRSNGLGEKLSVKVKPNDTGVPHFDAARNMRNNILSSLNVPFTANEGMGYGNEGTVHHAGGSLRMSGDGTGVVDTNLKFEAYDNLYCADPSIWPFIPAANPALSLAALSIRLSQHLQNKL